jgi:hypothetical protein
MIIFVVFTCAVNFGLYLGRSLHHVQFPICRSMRGKSHPCQLNIKKRFLFFAVEKTKSYASAICNLLTR